MNTAIVIWYIGATFTFGWLLHYANKNEEFRSIEDCLLAAFVSTVMWPFVLGGEFHRVLTEGRENLPK